MNSLFDSLLHSSHKSSKDDILDQILELEKKKLQLQQQKGELDVTALKSRLLTLQSEVSLLQTPETGRRTPPSGKEQNGPSFTPQLTKQALEMLLAEKENESFSDNEDEDDDEFLTQRSASTDRRISRDFNRFSSSHRDILKTHSLHPLSDRLNYNKIVQQGAAPISTLTGPSKYSPPPPKTNIRTISSTNERDSINSLGPLPPADEAIPRLLSESNEIITENELLGGLRTSIAADDFDLEFLNQSNNDGDNIGNVSPNQLQQHSNLLEFCIIEADWEDLIRSKQTTSPLPHQQPYLTSLIPPKLKWRYPSIVNEKTNNTSTIQEQNFFFPSGVKIELVSRPVMEIKTRKYNFKRHIVPFSDLKGLPLYACCLTIVQSYTIEEISHIHEDIPLQLYRLLRGKHAVKIIQKAFRRYQNNKKLKLWQTIDIGDIKKLQNANRFVIGGSTSSEVGGLGSVKGHEGRGSITSTNSATPHNPNNSENKTSFFSRFFKRNNDSHDPNHPSNNNNNNHSQQNQDFFNFSRHNDRASWSSSTHGTSTTASVPSTTNHPVTPAAPGTTQKPVPEKTPARSNSLFGFGRAKAPSNENKSLSFTIGSTTATKDSNTSVAEAETSLNLNVLSSDSGTNTSQKGTPIQNEHAVNKSSSLSIDHHEDTQNPINSEEDKNNKSTASLVEDSMNYHENNENQRKKNESIEEIILQSIDPHKDEQLDFMKEIEDKVIIGQKAYCIISSIPEYTFIFKILDAIYEAENEITLKTRSSSPVPITSPSGNNPFSPNSAAAATHDYHTIPESNQKNNSFNIESFPSPITNPESMNKLIPSSNSMNNLVNDNNNPEEIEHLRSKFLIKIKLFMERYFLTKHFQLEDLSNNFVVPKDYFDYKVNHYSLLQSTKQQKQNEFLESLIFRNKQRSISSGGNSGKNMEGNNIQEPRNLFPDPSQDPSLHINTNEKDGNSNTNSNFDSAVNTPKNLNNNNTATNESNSTSNHNLHNNNDMTIVSPRPQRSTTLVSEYEDGIAGMNNTNNNSMFFSPGKSGLKRPFSTRVLCPYACNIRVRGYGKPVKIDFRYLLNTKEWSCAVLFTHLNAQVIFKMINLLLMEKSLIIYGKNPGIVSAITLGVINLISPFLWEGIFIPLVPDIARELFGAPVPLIIGTISPPRITDISPATAILHLNDDSIQAKLEFVLTNKPTILEDSSQQYQPRTPTASTPVAEGLHSHHHHSKGTSVYTFPDDTFSHPPLPPSATTAAAAAATGDDHSSSSHSHRGVRIPSLLRRKKSNQQPPPSSSSLPIATGLPQQESQVNVYIKEIDFLAWFTRLPEVSADMPIPDEISKRITHLRRLFCKYLLPHLHFVYDILLLDPKTILEELNNNSSSVKATSSVTPVGSPTLSLKSPLTSSTVPPPADQNINDKGDDSTNQNDSNSNNNSNNSHNNDVNPTTTTIKKTLEKTILIKNTIDHIFILHHLPEILLKQINLLLIRIKDYNYHFCGNLLSNTYDWNRFLKKNEKTNIEEFYPNLFLEPIRNKLEFQEAIVHTQMFISFMDRLRKESQMLNQIREFIADWIYRQFLRKRKARRLLYQQQQQQQQQQQLQH